MPDDNRYNEDDKNSRKGEFKVPPRTWLVWIAIFGGIILLMLFKEKMDTPGDLLSQSKFWQLVDSNMIEKATVNYSPQSQALNEITGVYYTMNNERKVETPFRAKVRLTQSMEEKLYA